MVKNVEELILSHQKVYESLKSIPFFPRHGLRNPVSNFNHQPSSWETRSTRTPNDIGKPGHPWAAPAAVGCIQCKCTRVDDLKLPAMQLSRERWRLDQVELELLHNLKAFCSGEFDLGKLPEVKVPEVLRTTSPPGQHGLKTDSKNIFTNEFQANSSRWTVGFKGAFGCGVVSREKQNKTPSVNGKKKELPAPR